MQIITSKEFVEQELRRAAQMYEHIETGRNELWCRDEEHMKFLRQVKICRALVMRLTGKYIPEINSFNVYSGYKKVADIFSSVA